MSRKFLADWAVIADHPTLKRIDEYGMLRHEAARVARELDRLGYENIKMFKQLSGKNNDKETIPKSL